VAVKAGKGPDSHILDFETEESAKDWISTKAKYWPGGEQSRTGSEPLSYVEDYFQTMGWACCWANGRRPVYQRFVLTLIMDRGADGVE
jgi:hypothetical protein